ncbi:MAG: hypothetical protein H0W67_08760 [Gemmatimonadales bacterium]|nr:hypothetical protein [Gemmatimonadales bacterium]
MSDRDSLAEYRRKRDFERTAEPEGKIAAGKIAAAKPARSKSPALAFVIQKHRASHLHFDLRLELDGVMKSWAVPKGPSVDPAVKRLAMEVEDHPIEYNSFEGTIPSGEYGGGTVMLWERGTYGYGGDGPDPMEGLHRGYAKGDFKIVLQGERLKGSWVLVRTRRDSRGKAQWLLIKHRDEHAREGADVVAEYETSVTTGRTMDEIAGGAKPKKQARPTARKAVKPVVKKAVETAVKKASKKPAPKKRT